MAHGDYPVRHPLVFNRTAALSATQTVQSHPALGTVGQVRSGRRQPVRRVGHSVGSHHWHGEYRRRSHGHHVRRTGRRILVLADRRVGHLDQVCRRTAGRQIPHPYPARQNAGRPHVCLGTGNGHEMARRLVLHLHGVRLVRYRQSGAKQRHIHAVLRDIPCAAGTYRNGSSRMRGFGRHFRRERYRTCL